MGVFVCISIIEDSIISQSKLGIVANDWWVFRLIRSNQTIHSTQSHKCLLLNKDKNGQWIENGFSDLIRPLWVLNNVFWAFQHTGQLSGLH